MSQIVERIRELQPGLPEAQRTLAALILADPAAVAARTILELADTAGVSTGSITRLCRTLGLSGYSQLRLALAADAAQGPPRETGEDPGRRTWRADMGDAIGEQDGIRRVAEVVTGAVGAVVADTIDRIDLAELDRAAALIAAARRVELFGTGGSATMAAEFQQRLYRIGIPAWSWPDVHVALTGAALLGPGDVVVALSHSGRTREPCDVLAEGQSRGATTIAVTNAADAPLARHAELPLITAVSAEGAGTEAILARHAQMAVLDVLYVAIAQRTYLRSTAAMAATIEAVRPHKQPLP